MYRTHVLIKVYVYFFSSFRVLNLLLHSWRPDFAEVSRTSYEVEPGRRMILIYSSCLPLLASSSRFVLRPLLSFLSSALGLKLWISGRRRFTVSKSVHKRSTIIQVHAHAVCVLYCVPVWHRASVQCAYHTGGTEMRRAANSENNTTYNFFARWRHATAGALVSVHKCVSRG